MNRLLAVSAATLVITGVVSAASSATSQFRHAQVVIVGVSSSPEGVRLNDFKANVVAVTPKLRFRVRLENGYIVRHVAVSVQISRGKSIAPVVLKRNVSLKANQSTSVALPVLKQTVLFAQRLSLLVKVSDAAHGQVWIKPYPVIFSLG